VKTPVVVAPSATQLVIGAGFVPQHVPRTEIAAGRPREVTLAPSVAEVVVIDEADGDVTVGTMLTLNDVADDEIAL
jgi:hypothetical protein